MGTITRLQQKATSEPPISQSLPAFLKAWLDHDLALSQQAGKALAVYVVRIDGYQALADKISGTELERAIAEVGSKLKTNLRSTDSFIRSSEDYFTIIQPFSGDGLALHGTAKALLQSLQQGQSADERHLAVSIGIAFYPEDGNSAEMLLQRAYDALHRTDQWGGNGFCVYSRSVAAKIADDLTLHQDLRCALKAKDLSLRFQPVVDLAQGSMHIASGDLAWNHPAHGCMDTREIAAIAERADLLPELNEWLASELHQQSKTWCDAGFQRTISIPLSRAQIEDGLFARCLSKRICQSGLAAELIEIQVDHDLLLNEADHRLYTGLHQLADLGIALAASDVGDGPLALKRLQQLPFDIINLSASMVAAIGRCSSSATLLKTVVRLGHDLDLCLRASDVSSQEQLKLLRDFGCDEASGPLFAPALKSADLDRLIVSKSCYGQHEALKLMPQHTSMH